MIHKPIRPIQKYALYGGVSFVLVLFLGVFLWQPQTQAASPKKIYKKALKKWSRQQEVYQREDFYVSIDWTATYQSPEFVEAKASRMNQIYDFRGEKARDVLLKEQEKFSKYTGFYVAFYTYQYRFSDLNSKGNGWKLYLEANGERYEPVKIEALKRLRPLYQTLYPYSNLWSRHYYIYFPKVNAAPSDIKLKVTGPLGYSTLSWGE